MVQRYAAGPALALRAAKQAIDDGLDVDLATGLEIERVQFAALFGTEDQRAGMRSFLETAPAKPPSPAADPRPARLAPTHPAPRACYGS